MTDIKPFSSEMKSYKPYESDNQKEIDYKHDINYLPFSKKNVDIPEHKEQNSNLNVDKDAKGKYYNFEIEKFSNTQSATSAIISVTLIIVLIVFVMFLFRYIELIAGGCPITVFELFVGRCGKRI